MLRDDIPPFLVEAFAGSPGELREAAELLRREELPVDGALLAAGGQSLTQRVSELPHCFAPFYSRVSLLFEMPEEQTIDLLARTDWEPTALKGIRTRSVDTELSCPGTTAVLVCFEPGLRYPRHRHHTTERVMVLSGSYVADDGDQYCPGDLHVMEAGTEHRFVVDKAEPCIAAAVHDDPIDFTGPLLGPASKFLRWMERRKTNS